MADEDKTSKKTAKKTAVEKAVPKKAAVKKAGAKKAVAKKAAPKAKDPIVAETAAPKVAPKKAAAPKADSGVKKLSVTLVRSKHGRLASHKACVSGLGLRRMHQTVQVIDTRENRGMINKVQYMLKVEEA